MILGKLEPHSNLHLIYLVIFRDVSCKDLDVTTNNPTVRFLMQQELETFHHKLIPEQRLVFWLVCWSAAMRWVSTPLLRLAPTSSSARGKHPISCLAVRAGVAIFWTARRGATTASKNQAQERKKSVVAVSWITAHNIRFLYLPGLSFPKTGTKSLLNGEF